MDSSFWKGVGVGAGLTAATVWVVKKVKNSDTWKQIKAQVDGEPENVSGEATSGEDPFPPVEEGK